MGRILPVLEFDQANASKKSMAYRRNTDGFHAPGNSLDFNLNNHAVNENLYSSQAQLKSTRMIASPNVTSLRKLIDDEISSRQSSGRHSPNVVARLMGMEPLPSEAISMVPGKEWDDDTTRSSLCKRELNETAKYLPMPQHALPPTKAKMNERSPTGLILTPSHQTKDLNIKRPQPREHPQEELLQKFKKEFVAWQASMASDQSRMSELNSDLGMQRDSQFYAQGKHNRENPTRDEDSKSKIIHSNAESRNYFADPKLHFETERGSLQLQEYKGNKGHASIKSDHALLNGARKDNYEQLAITMFDDKRDRPTSPTRIIVLKPGSDRSGPIDESWPASSGTINREGSMRDFLEEVRERLRYEVEGKAWDYVGPNACTNNSSEHSPDENSMDSRPFARRITKKVRENTTMDLGSLLMRSESPRSYASEAQYIEPYSPEFFNKETRKLSTERKLVKKDTRKPLAERLKKVLKNRKEMNISSPINVTSGIPILFNEKLVCKPINDFCKTGEKRSSWDERRVTTESKARSFRLDQVNAYLGYSEASSPRGLVRSLSAPVSGTVVNKLNFDDQHLLTGAHNWRKHEASGQIIPEIRKNKKDVFNFKGKVSNLKQNFTFKSKLFGKKNQSMDASSQNEFHSTTDLDISSSTSMTLSIVQDNYTEVPPSPVSPASSPRDELYRPCHPSPVSPLEAPFTEEQHSSQEYGDLSPHLPILSEAMPIKEQVEVVQRGSAATEPVEFERESGFDKDVDTESPIQTFVRDILVTAGLYREVGGNSDQVFTWCDPLTEPIALWVFEELEGTFKKAETPDNREQKYPLNNKDKYSSQRKLLFDLVNEALPRVAKSHFRLPASKKWSLAPAALPHGKKLLDDLWHQIQVIASPVADDELPLDSDVCYDSKSGFMTGISMDDVKQMGAEIEGGMLEALIDEIVCDMFL